MNLKNTIVLFAALLIAGLACRREPDNPVTKNFPLTGFTKITAGDDHEIVITEGNNFAITVKGGATDVSELRMQVVNENLKIDYPTFRNRRKQVHIYITMPSISSFDFGGAAYGTVSGFQMAGVIANLSGAADFELEAEVNELNVFTSGAARLTAKGSAVKINAEASGQSMYKGYNVSGTDEAVIKTSGQAQVWLNVNRLLEAEASGQSIVHYRGSPVAKNINLSGQAKVVNE